MLHPRSQNRAQFAARPRPRELPKEVRCFVVLISNYGGAGFVPLRHAGAKLLDISSGEEAARPIAEWHHYSKFEQEADVTQVGSSGVDEHTIYNILPVGMGHHCL